MAIKKFPMKFLRFSSFRETYKSKVSIVQEIPNTDKGDYLLGWEELDGFPSFHIELG